MRSAPTYPHSFTALRFQTLFNIVVIWMAVFIALSKGTYLLMISILAGLNKNRVELKATCLARVTIVEMY